MDSGRTPLACPVCDGALESDGQRFFCANGHFFDIAREGYVNLLPPHRDRGVSGDVPEMLQARRRFLEAGYFDPLRDLLAEQTAAALSARSVVAGAPVLIEAGCGDGFYVGSIGAKIRTQREAVLLGCDVSKAAARLAARRHREALFFVADVRRRIYLAAGTASVVLDVFAPRNAGEFARILEPGGSAVIAIPSPSHLADLRTKFGLLDIEPAKEARVVESFAASFRLRERVELAFALDLAPEAVRDLVEMGPNHWHGRAVGVESSMIAEASFIVLRFECLATPI